VWVWGPTVLSCLPAVSRVQAEGPVSMKLLTGLVRIFVESFSLELNFIYSYFEELPFFSTFLQGTLYLYTHTCTRTHACMHLQLQCLRVYVIQSLNSSYSFECMADLLCLGGGGGVMGEGKR